MCVWVFVMVRGLPLTCVCLCVGVCVWVCLYLKLGHAHGPARTDEVANVLLHAPMHSKVRG